MRRTAVGKAKSRLGISIDAAQSEPVTIEKHGRSVAVMMSADEHEEIEATRLEALRTKIRRGLADIVAGRVTGAERVFTDIETMVRRAKR